MPQVLNNLDEEIMAGREMREKKNLEKIARDMSQNGGMRMPQSDMSREERKDENEEMRRGMPSRSEEGKTGEIADQLRKDKKSAKDQAAQKVKVLAGIKEINPAHETTGRVLFLAWLNVIDSFGLTFLYVNLHVFYLYRVLPDIFCAPGEEWVPKNIRSMGGKKVKEAGATIGLLEIALVAGIDLIILFLVLMQLTFFIIMIDVYLHPIENWAIVWSLLGEAFNTFFR